MDDTSVPTNADEVDEVDEAAHEAARLRGPRRLLVAGPLVSLLLAFASGLVGLDGRAGFFLMLMLLAVTFGVTGVWVGVQLLLDEFRGAPTSTRRGLLTAGMFVATLVCMTAVGGVAASLEGTP